MKKLIFVDDSPLDHYILKRILKKYNLNYEVNCTSNGGEVLQFLRQHQGDGAALPDVILLDLYMPLFNAWEFLENVQLLYSSLAKPVRFYILSASIDPSDINRAKQFPVVRSFVFKPITREALQRLVDEEITAK